MKRELMIGRRRLIFSYSEKIKVSSFDRDGPIMLSVRIVNPERKSTMVVKLSMPYYIRSFMNREEILREKKKFMDWVNSLHPDYFLCMIYRQVLLYGLDYPDENGVARLPHTSRIKKHYIFSRTRPRDSVIETIGGVKLKVKVVTFVSSKKLIDTMRNK